MVANFNRYAVLWQAFKSGSSGAELYEPIRGERDMVDGIHGNYAQTEMDALW
jgi:hypothetical protein